MIIPILCTIKSFFQSVERGDFCLLQPRQSATVKVSYHVQWDQLIINIGFLFVYRTMLCNVWAVLTLFVTFLLLTKVLSVYVLKCLLDFPNCFFYQCKNVFACIVLTFCWCKQIKFSYGKIKWYLILSYLILSYIILYKTLPQAWAPWRALTTVTLDPTLDPTLQPSSVWGALTWWPTTISTPAPMVQFSIFISV